MERLKKMAARMRSKWEGSLIGKLLARYGQYQGSLMASGLAYGLLFAFFAGIWSLFSVFGVVFSNNDAFRTSFLGVLDSMVPGIASGSNAILSESALAGISTTLTITGLVTLVAFWWKITSWMGSLRTSVQTILGAGKVVAPDNADESEAESEAVAKVSNPLLARLIDTLAVLAVGALFILTTAAGTLSGGLISSLLRVFNLLDSSVLQGFFIGLAGFAVSVGLNMVLLIVLFRLVCQVKRRKAVRLVSLIGAFALSVIQLLGGRLLNGASSNPLLAPFAAIVAVLIWFNILTQVLLYCAALLGEVVDRMELAA